MSTGLIFLPTQPEEQAAFTRMIAHVAEITGIADTGFRVISNIGTDGHQEVPHLRSMFLVANPLAECCPQLKHS